MHPPAPLTIPLMPKDECQRVDKTPLRAPGVRADTEKAHVPDDEGRTPAGTAPAVSPPVSTDAARVGHCDSCDLPTCGGATPDPGDTGIQIAMRTLLSIVAGLLIADMLKITVRIAIGDGWTCCQSAADVALSTAALAFIGKVVIDNVLHYHEADWVFASRLYWHRWFLVVLDLASYALCYTTVALFDIASGARVTIYPTVVVSLAALAAVELLHWFWCDRAMALARTGGICADDDRVSALKVWRNTSCASAALGVAAFTWVSYRPIDGPVTRSTVSVFILFCVLTIGMYAFARRAEYLRRRPK